MKLDASAVAKMLSAYCEHMVVKYLGVQVLRATATPSEEVTLADDANPTISVQEANELRHAAHTEYFATHRE